MDLQVELNQSLHYILYFYYNFIFYEIETGKTRILTASIHEIVRGTSGFVLVLAHSNAACEELTIRLLDLLNPGEIFRLYAKSYKKEALNARIKPISNLHNNDFQFPCLKFLYQFRVVVVTLLTAGSLVRAREHDKSFKSDHFTHVIIDEAGCIHEPASMIPIAGLHLFGFKIVFSRCFITLILIMYNIYIIGLCSENSVVRAKIVFAGDPKQLDAVTKSKDATKLGYSRSFMEYLMENKKCYMPHPILKRFDPNFITVLTANYRSHEAILAIPNELFYDNVLVAKGKFGTIHSYTIHIFEKYSNS